jgi:hypothetical protein
MINRFEKARAQLRTRLSELEEKRDAAADEAARLLIKNQMNAFEATSRHGKQHDATIAWLEDVLAAVDRVEVEEKEIEQREANKRSMLLEGLRSDSVEGSTLRDLAERVHRNLSWKNPRDGVQLYGAALGRELRKRGIQIEGMDREILLAASKTKHDLGTSSYEARALLGGFEGDL